MGDNVEHFPASDSYTVPQAVDYTKKCADADVLDRVLCIGFRKDNGDLYSVGSAMTRAEALWLIKQAEMYVLELKHAE